MHVMEKWISLFESQMKIKEDVKVLEEVDVGYISTVYLISVDGKEYAVKVYHKRYNGCDVCIEETNNVERARNIIPDVIPKVVFYSKHTENKFEREILVLEKVEGHLLSKEIFCNQVFENLLDVLKRLHSKKTDKLPLKDPRRRLKDCEETIMNFVNNNTIPKRRVKEHLCALEEYYFENRDIFKVCKSIIHGDLWWDNVLVDNGKIRIVDWLESDEHDYCRDLAQFKIGTLDQVLDTHRSDKYFMKTLSAYSKLFEDRTIPDRMRYYLPLMYLEESFYLPFKYFSWEIKCKEDHKAFDERFVRYFNKSKTEFDRLR